MPKVSASLRQKLGEWIIPFNLNKRVFSTDGTVIFCNACNKNITCEKKFQLTQHANTGFHISAVKSKFSAQSMLPATSSTSTLSKDNFFEDLCFALVSSDIPFNKVNHPPFKHFLEKYTSRKIPDESTLRKNYLLECYKKTVENIKNVIKENYVYIIVDETTDARGFYIANLLVGVLKTDEPGSPFLLSSKRLEKTNAETISRFINNSLKLLWSDPGFEMRVLLLLTDAAPYMTKAAKNLTVFYGNMVHVTCVAHAMNRLAEKVREIFSEVNKLVNNGKKMFLKAPSRVSIYKEKMGSKPLPPAPVVTRWGTWINAALFYAENLNQFTTVVEEIVNIDRDTQCVQKVAEILKRGGLRNDLAFISCHLSFLPDSITKLEKRSMPLEDSLYLMNEINEKINLIPGQVGIILKEKMSDLYSKNTGLQLLSDINKVLQGNNNLKIEKYNDPLIVSAFKFAPITSVDVERSFSIYKCILTDRRHAFTEENLEMYLVVNYNNAQ